MTRDWLVRQLAERAQLGELGGRADARLSARAATVRSSGTPSAGLVLLAPAAVASAGASTDPANRPPRLETPDASARHAKDSSPPDIEPDQPRPEFAPSPPLATIGHWLKRAVRSVTANGSTRQLLSRSSLWRSSRASGAKPETAPRDSGRQTRRGGAVPGHGLSLVNGPVSRAWRYRRSWSCVRSEPLPRPRAARQHPANPGGCRRRARYGGDPFTSPTQRSHCDGDRSDLVEYQ